MNNKEYLDWVSGIVRLTKDQAEDLTIRLKQLGLIVRGPKAEPEVENDWLFHGICTVLESQGLSSKGQRSHLWTSYVKHSVGLKAELEKLITGDTPKTQAHLVLGFVCGRALLNWCRKNIRAGVTGGMVMLNVHHTREALEMAFPGYINAGLFRFIIIGGGNG